jgi:hypothetical protein
MSAARSWAFRMKAVTSASSISAVASLTGTPRPPNASGAR